MKFANEDVQKQIVYRKDEIKMLQEELARTEAETKLVQEQLAKVTRKLAEVRATADRIDIDNRRLVAQLAAKQQQAVEALKTAQATP
jgi:ethanolamine utilization protein EutA (predicted chaperonin)